MLLLDEDFVLTYCYHLSTYFTLQRGSGCSGGLQANSANHGAGSFQIQGGGNACSHPSVQREVARGESCTQQRKCAGAV